MSLLDVIGPVMVGPSSSHTAGACRLALLARTIFGDEPTAAHYALHGSFAKTGRGHGTDLALIAGTLGAYPDDPRIAAATEEAAANGLAVTFVHTDLGDVHPNSVRITLTRAERTTTVTGSSLGGGIVRVFDVDGFRIDVGGGHPTLLIRHRDAPGVIARVARVIADEEINIATLVCARRKRGGEAMMSVEVDRPLPNAASAYLEHLRDVTWVRQLPNVMQNGEGSA
jgi:L-serine dehydratase